MHNHQTQHLPFHLGIMIVYHYETMHIDSIIVEAMGLSLGNGIIDIIIVEMYIGHRVRCHICRRGEDDIICSIV